MSFWPELAAQGSLPIIAEYLRVGETITGLFFGLAYYKVVAVEGDRFEWNSMPAPGHGRIGGWGYPNGEHVEWIRGRHAFDNAEVKALLAAGAIR